MPAIMRFIESDVRDPGISSQTLHVRLLMLLEHLQNMFFIERLLHRCGSANNRELLSVSFEMTSTTMLFWTNMDGLGMLCEDFKWLVSKLHRPRGSPNYWFHPGTTDGMFFPDGVYLQHKMLTRKIR